MSAGPLLTTRAEAEALLRKAGGLPEARIPLAETAMAFSLRERPGRDAAPYRAHLAALAEGVRERLGGRSEATEAASLEARLDALRGVMVEREGYGGDALTYDDLDNADLLAVIDRRKGLPVALGILYIETAERLGWDAAGLAFPGHFLIRMTRGGEAAVVDPFDRLAILGAADLRRLIKATEGESAELQPGHYATAGKRAVLLRLQNNRKLRLLRQRSPEAAVETLEAMLMMAPAQVELWREAGLLHAHLGNLRAAMVSLEQVLDLTQDYNQRREAENLLKELRARLN